MNYLQNSFLKIGVLSLTLLVLGCSNQANDVEAKKANVTVAASTVVQDDSQYDAEFKKLGEIYISGAKNQDKNQMREALKMISDLIEKEPNNTKFLGQRISIYMSLDEPDHALIDLEKRNSLKKSGVFKFGECALKDSMTYIADSSACYKEAADIFSNELAEPEKDGNYLIALLYSGDGKAKQKIQSFMKTTENDWEKEGLEMYLGAYQKYTECKKLAVGPCPIS